MGWTPCPYPDNVSRITSVVYTGSAACREIDPGRQTTVQAPDNEAERSEFSCFGSVPVFTALLAIAAKTKVGIARACAHLASDVNCRGHGNKGGRR